MLVAGSDVNVSALAGIKSIADLKKLNMYSHLSGLEAEDAYKELLAVLVPVKDKTADSE